jgi:peptidylprolyl isomerase
MNRPKTATIHPFLVALLLSGGCAHQQPATKAPAPEEKTAAAAPAADAEGGDPLAAPADVAAPPDDAQRTASGLAHRVLRPGSGTTHPGPTTTVEVHYTGWTTDGKMFDSSVARGETIRFPLDGVIKGWTEGVQLMVEGEKRRFWIPAELAYGETPTRPGAPAGMLVFDIELISIVP